MSSGGQARSAIPTRRRVSPRALRYRVNERLKLWCLASRPYHHNVSIARILSNRDIAREFRDRAPLEPPPDVVFAAYPIPELAGAGLAYARAHAIPSVIDIRDLWPDIWATLLPPVLRPLANFALYPFYRQSRYLLRHYTSICGITEPMVDWGVDRAGRARGPWDRAFPLGYPEQSYPPLALDEARRTWSERLGDLPAPRLSLCYFGAMGPRSGIDVVIKAMRLLPETDRNQIRVVLCGSGDTLDSFRRLAYGMPEIVFPGWVTGPQIQALASSSDFGLLPYRNDADYARSIPNKAIEYMAHGLPVLASLKGPVLDLISSEKCGLIYRESDPVDLARTIGDLLERPAQLTALKDNAARVFVERFRAANVYGKMADMLVDLATEGSRQRARS